MQTKKREVLKKFDSQVCLVAEVKQKSKLRRSNDRDKSKRVVEQ